MKGSWVAGLAVLVGGCVSPTSYACTDASMCFVGQVVGQCQPTGFCSFPDGECASGQRYGKFAGSGLADACVPSEGETTGSTTDTTTGPSGSSGGPPVTTFGTMTESGSTSESTTGPGPISASVGDDSSTGGEVTTFTTFGTDDTGTTTGGFTTFTTFDDTGTTTGGIDPPFCADFNFGDGIAPTGFIADASIYDDQFSASCYPGNHVDVVFYWVAPLSGPFEFVADVDPAEGIDVAGTIRPSCEGPELVCDDDGGEVLDSRIVYDVTAGQDYLYIVTVNGQLDAGVEVSISPK